MPLLQKASTQETTGYFTLPDIKRIHVYTNGDEYQPATNFIVHPRRIRSYEVFLKDLTDKIKPGFGAVRTVYTPVNGSRVRDLEDLENHQRYVVAGYEPFRKLKYADIDLAEAKRRARRKSSKPVPTTQKKVGKSIRRRPYRWENVHIFVYQNGDDVIPPVRITVRRDELENWEHVLLRISDRLDQPGFVKRLYNLNGDWVRGPNGIKNGQYYVAVSGYDSFKLAMYGKLIDRLPQEFLGESFQLSQQRKLKQSTKPKKHTNTHKVVPKIMAPPPVAKKFKPKTTSVNGNTSNVNKSNRTQEKAKRPEEKAKRPEEKAKRPEEKPRVRPQAKRIQVSDSSKLHGEDTIKATAKPTGPKTSLLPRHFPILNPIASSKRPMTTAQSKKVPVPMRSTAKTAETKKLPHTAIKTPSMKYTDTVVVLRSAIHRKSPPDSEDSAYISENEKLERRRRLKSSSRPKSFKVITERSSYTPNRDGVYYASATKKHTQKRVTLVDYDEDASGIYRAKPESAEVREVKELENIPVDLPLDEVEATEVGEESEYDDEEEEEEEYFKNADEQETRQHTVTRSESHIRSPATTVS